MDVLIQLFNYKIVTGSQGKQVSVNLTLINLNQTNSWCIKCIQYIQNKIKNKLRIKAINYAYFKLEERATRGVKKNKNKFINAKR